MEQAGPSQIAPIRFETKKRLNLSSFGKINAKEDFVDRTAEELKLTSASLLSRLKGPVKTSESERV